MDEKKAAPKVAHLEELDYLKSIMILLMVSFHLVHFSELYPYAKQVVYTFHMPVLIFISGYLMNIDKPVRQFLSKIWWFFVPYAVMESGYVVMASLLPIREHIDQLTMPLFLNKLVLHPLGPYWYLHTLMLCGLVYYGISRLPRLKPLPRYILIALLYALCAMAGILSLSISFYFLAGIILRHSGCPFLRVVQSSWLSLPAAAWLMASETNLSPATSGGALIVYLVMSFLLVLYPLLRGSVRQCLLFIGRHTLVIFIFSPIFTILCKLLVPYLTFDHTGMLFLLLSLLICIGGCFVIGWLMDVLRLSPFFFGKHLGLGPKA